MKPFSFGRTGPLGGLLVASWEPLGGLLGASWGLLGPLGSLLGRLGRLLGALGRLLGASWADIKKRTKIDPQNGTCWAPKMAPKRDPKRAKIEDKIEHQKSNLLRPSWERLGAILGRFRCPLEVTECTLPRVALVF